jgi:SAM-dependent methyltransferase
VIVHQAVAERGRNHDDDGLRTCAFIDLHLVVSLRECVMSEYDRFARLYDLEHRDLSADLELYRNFALRCDGPVLELGCGSGRVSIPLAQSGLNVTGIDRSTAMLELARARAAEAGLTERLCLEQVDLRTPAFRAQFALAICPLNGFLHLLTVEDQLAALRSAHRALLPGGFLIVDLPNPHTVFVPGADGRLFLRRRFFSPEGYSIASFTVAQTDLSAQRQYLTLIYDQEDADGQVCRTTVESELRFVYRYEMALLLERCGFEVDGVYGSYDLDPYEMNSDLMLFVARTAEAAQ